jgi:hypothetical protein
MMKMGEEGDLIKQVFVGAELKKLRETEHELGLDDHPRGAGGRVRCDGGDDDIRHPFETTTDTPPSGSVRFRRVIVNWRRDRWHVKIANYLNSRDNSDAPP